MKKLTGKQHAFVLAYLSNNYNGTAAARTAGYQGSDQTLAAVAYENLRKPHIAGKIADYFRDQAMPAEEAMFRIAQIARLSIGDFIKITEHGWKIDLDAVAEKGHLVKRIKETLTGPEILLHDSLKGLELIGKSHGQFAKKVELEAEKCLILDMPIPEGAMEGPVREEPEKKSASGSSPTLRQLLSK